MHSRRGCLTIVFLLEAALPFPALAQSVAVAPANVTVLVGQTQQFTAAGTVAPTESAAGGEYSCVRMPDGSVHCTGRNQFGQLGSGNWTDGVVPMPVTALSSVAHVIGGDEFTCALISGGSMQCWGLGEKGQRGDGTFNQMSTVPVAVSGITTAVAAGAGYDHACALLADGTTQCWGNNDYGQLGNPSISGNSAVPVPVGGLSPPNAIAVGAFHTCAVMSDGTAQCWGRNDSGQVGDGTMNNAASPVAVAGLSSVAAIAAGGSHTCALITGGTVQCWGDNYQGQLGDGTTTPSATPVAVAGVSTAVAIAAGWTHSCALLQDGSAQCWGEGVDGELGSGAAQNSSTAVTVVGITGATGISAGWWHHSCATTPGGVRCWGTNTWGQLGNGTQSSTVAPVAMSSAGITWSSDTPDVVTIDPTGLATAAKAGVATITATDSSGAAGTTQITVVKPRYLLSVAKTGATQSLGTVTASSGNINCGSACSDMYESDTVVTLTASPAALLTGWTGCDSTSGATCIVTVESARSVVAKFVDAPSVQ